MFLSHVSIIQPRPRLTSAWQCPVPMSYGNRTLPRSRESGDEAIDHIRRSYICISLVDLSGCLSMYSVVVCHYVSFQWVISVSIKLNLLIYRH